MKYILSKYSKVINLFKLNSSNFKMVKLTGSILLEFNRWDGFNMIRLSVKKHKSNIRKTIFGKPKVVDVLICDWNYVSEDKQTEASYNYSEFMDDTTQKTFYRVFVMIAEEQLGIGKHQN